MVTIGLVLLLAVLMVAIGSLRKLKLAVPDFFDLVDLVGAETEPALHLRSLLDGLLSLWVFVGAALFIVEGLLGNVAQLKRDLDDLTEVQA